MHFTAEQEQTVKCESCERDHFVGIKRHLRWDKGHSSMLGPLTSRLPEGGQGDTIKETTESTGMEHGEGRGHTLYAVLALAQQHEMARILLPPATFTG